MEDANKSLSSKLSKLKLKKPEASSSKVSLENEKVKTEVDKSKKDSEKFEKESKSSLKASKSKEAIEEKKFLKFKKPTSSATSLNKHRLQRSSSETIFDRSKPNISSMNADDSLMYGIDRVICLWKYLQQSINKKNT